MKKTILCAMLLGMTGFALANNGAVAKTAENKTDSTAKVETTATNSEDNVAKLPVQETYVCASCTATNAGNVCGWGVGTSEASACAQAKQDREAKMSSSTAAS